MIDEYAVKNSLSKILVSLIHSIIVQNTCEIIENLNLF